MLHRAILHLGPSKTGTTMIQGALSAIAGDLKASGIWYPETEPPSQEGQPSLAWEILESLGKPVARLSQARLTWERALNDATSSGAHTLLVSSEDFSHEFFDASAFGALRQLLGNADVTIVFGLRDPCTRVPSMWQQSVKWGIGFGEELLDIDDAVSFLIARRAASVIPHVELAERSLDGRLRLFTVPQRVEPRTLLARFAEAAELPAHLVNKFSRHSAGRNSNEALSYSQSLLLLHLNRLFARLEPEASTYPDNAPADRIAAREAIIRSLHPEKRTRIPLSETSQARLLAARDEIVNWASGRTDLIGSLSDLSTAAIAGVPDVSNGSNGHADSEVLARALVHLARQLVDQHRYVVALEEARDFWKSTSDGWEQQAKASALPPPAAGSAD